MVETLFGVVVAVGRVRDVSRRSDGFERLCKDSRACSHLLIEIETSVIDVEDDCSLVLEGRLDSPADNGDLKMDLPIRTLGLYDARGADGLRTIPPGPSCLRVTRWRDFAPLSSCMHLRGIFLRRVDTL